MSEPSHPDPGRRERKRLQQLDHLAKSHQWWDGRSMRAENVQSLGFDPAALVVQHWIEMTNTLMGFPRHLSQHTGPARPVRQEA